jgi:hypothetical protein
MYTPIDGCPWENKVLPLEYSFVTFKDSNVLSTPLETLQKKFFSRRSHFEHL